MSAVRFADGIHSALVTPFFDDESVDFEGLGRLVDDQINAGIAGLLVNGSTGEVAALTAAEREQTAQAVIAHTEGRAEVIVGLASVRTRDSIRFAEHALAAGATGGLLMMPYYEPLSADENADFVREVAEVGLPLMIYNNPGATGECLTPEFIARLGEIDNVVAIKDTTSEPRRLFALERLTEGRLQVLSGHDTSQVFAMLAGHRSVVWGGPNVHPTSCVALWNLAVRDRDLEATIDFWRQIYPLSAFLETHDYMATTKAGANIRGLRVGKPRRPIQPLSQQDMAELTVLIDAADAAVAALDPALLAPSVEPGLVVGR